jgi:hypothetical protein
MGWLESPSATGISSASLQAIINLSLTPFSQELQQ